MELGLSLGDPPKPFAGFLEKNRDRTNDDESPAFCMDLSIGPICPSTGREDGSQEEPDERQQRRDDVQIEISNNNANGKVEVPAASASSEPPVQLDLLPLAPVPRSHGFPWSSSNDNNEGGGSCGLMELNRVSRVGEEAEEGAAVSSSPNSNSGGSSFQMDICLYNYRGSGAKRDHSADGEPERASSRASDEDDPINGGNRKKLRLSKEQSAFLEESFKEHNTLNPKQKLALAKQLNLRPRQVEVWFQNRRARTKLKQTEVDCEYLKRCCETLTEENRRLHKELQELRALKTSNPFYMQLPATTLTMCPSCERVATTAGTNSNNPNSESSKAAGGAAGFPLNRPKLYPFSHTKQAHSHQSSAAS